MIPLNEVYKRIKWKSHQHIQIIYTHFLSLSHSMRFRFRFPTLVFEVSNTSMRVYARHSLVIVVQVNIFLARFYANTYMKHILSLVP